MVAMSSTVGNRNAVSISSSPDGELVRPFIHAKPPGQFSQHVLLYCNAIYALDGACTRVFAESYQTVCHILPKLRASGELSQMCRSHDSFSSVGDVNMGVSDI